MAFTRASGCGWVEKVSSNMSHWPMITVSSCRRSSTNCGLEVSLVIIPHFHQAIIPQGCKYMLSGAICIPNVLGICCFEISEDIRGLSAQCRMFGNAAQPLADRGKLPVTLQRPVKIEHTLLNQIWNHRVFMKRALSGPRAGACPSCGAKPGEKCESASGQQSVRAPWSVCLKRVLERVGRRTKNSQE